MKRTFILIAAIIWALTSTACAKDMAMLPNDGYKKVSDLVPLPEFIPGMGTLYVQPETLPVGPFLAYDRDRKLVATIYMVPMAEMQKQKPFKGLSVGHKDVKAVAFAYNAGHPGVNEPHYHVTLWHVEPGMAKVN